MKKENLFGKACGIFVAFTIVCGVLYTGVVTGAAQVIAPKQANGSMIEIDGKVYGCELMGQEYTEDNHMWGRIMNVDVSTFQDKDGNWLMYSGPSNLSPASEEYQELVAQRVMEIKASHPEMGDTPIPVDLVTCSGSGLDPHISPAAAQYQVQRLARTTGKSEAEIQSIINKSTDGRFLGIFGEPTVNVLEVNLRLDGIME